MQLIKEIQTEGLVQIIRKYNLLSKFIDNKVLLKYSQIDSYEFRFVKACRQARGIILEIDPNNNNTVLDTPISFSYERFFNLGESQEEIDNFDWKNYSIEEKKDGSIITMYWDTYYNSWQAATSGTIYGNATLPQDASKTFAEYFWQLTDFYITDLNKDYVYSFELCSLENQVVVAHTIPHVTLLNVRDRTKIATTSNYGELTKEKIKNIANLLRVDIVKVFVVSQREEILDVVNSQPGHTFEGVILVDKNGNRIKVKNADYVQWHHNISDINDLALIKLIYTNEIDEAIVYFPHIQARINTLGHMIDKHIRLCLLVYFYYNKLHQTILQDKRIFFDYFLQDRKKLAIFKHEIESAILNQCIPLFNSIVEAIENGENEKLKKYIKFLDSEFN